MLSKLQIKTVLKDPFQMKPLGYADSDQCTLFSANVKSLFGLVMLKGSPIPFALKEGRVWMGKDKIFPSYSTTICIKIIIKPLKQHYHS